MRVFLWNSFAIALCPQIFDAIVGNTSGWISLIANSSDPVPRKERGIWDFPKIRVPYLGSLLFRILYFIRVPYFRKPPFCNRKDQARRMLHAPCSLCSLRTHKVNPLSRATWRCLRCDVDPVLYGMNGSYLRRWPM